MNPKASTPAAATYHQKTLGRVCCGGLLTLPSAGRGCVARASISASRAPAAGNASRRKAGPKWLDFATAMAIITGPSTAPVWSMAVWTPNPNPCPTISVDSESSTSRAGPRMALPVRSATISSAAICQLPAKASAGTTSRFMA